MVERVLRVTAVQIVAGEARPVAQVLLATGAIAAFAARPAEPGYADAVADGDTACALPDADGCPHDLMARHEVRSDVRELAIHDVQIVRHTAQA